MPLIDFNDVPRMGLEFMDADHAESVALANAMIGASEDQFPALFDKWLTHMREHFAREEALMDKIAFPPAPVHRGEHLRTLAGYDALREQMRRGQLAPARDYIENEFPQWLLNHAHTMDAATAAYARMKGFESD
ncbi:hemerythrin domain-containing protein [Magnetofaba australis]|uniref:Putative hemerythrin metal-binding domain-containing protein n=1 Tax=Magnetofaba australis IT-1 TaxID=1434232 RepID=A0A1Y2K4Y0_9PROT|nr:hemerythrin domain-containing protein [Magnetofaba australis]OSM02174.1 putative hemerythrin metal-binding domain-containing protein [Magnetofaba australis IT-1]